MMTKLFIFLKYLILPFTLLALYFILKGSYFHPNLEDVGFGVLCTGIAFGFSSMGDMTEISKREEKLFSARNRFRGATVFLLILGFLVFAATILFISQKWMIKNELGKQYFQLGLNCFPLVMAVFFTLKQLVDKKQFYELQKSSVSE